MDFLERHGSQPWLRQAKVYLQSRQQAIQERLINTFRFVELATQNGDTWSYEFASILRDSGSAFASVMDLLIKGESDDPEKRTNFADYRELLLREDPKFHLRTVAVRALYPGGCLIPFSTWAEPEGIPDWWHAYNQIKHSEYHSAILGNMRNAVSSLAALVIVEFFMQVSPRQDRLWVNIGIPYAPDSKDVSNERLLYRVERKASGGSHT